MRYTLTKRAVKTVLIAISASQIVLAEEKTEKAATNELASKAESSYAVGYSVGNAFAQNFGAHGVRLEDFDMEVFMKAFSTAALGDKPEMENEKLQAAMMSLSEFVQAREKSIAEENKKEGAKFLEENAKREGVVSKESGLQYEVIEKGGDKKYVAPAEGEQSNKLFMVNYKGTRIDGTEFDASEEGTPVAMTLQVVEGFREALTSMPVGAKWKLFIPSDMGYGERRASVDIGPNTTLIFELELVEIKDAPAQPSLEGLQIPTGE